MPTSSTALKADLVSPRRQSIKTNEETTKENNIAKEDKEPMRRSSSSQEMRNDDVFPKNERRTKTVVKEGRKKSLDKNRNVMSDRLARPKIQRRRSSTSGSLLMTADSEKSDSNNNNNNLCTSPRRNSSLSSGLISPRRGSLATGVPQLQQKPLSPRWINPGANLARRNSSTSAKFLSPTYSTESIFKFPAKRSQSFEFSAEHHLKGGLIMTEHSSLRAIEFEIEKQDKEKDNTDKELSKLEQERLHLEMLDSAVNDWIDVLKSIQRLSKGVPLMRSIRKACLDMNAKFAINAGVYGASLLALRRSELPTVKQISKDMEELRAMMDSGGMELSLVDGRFLEDAREVVGRLKGTIVASLKMFYLA